MATHTPGERIAELRKTYAISREVLAERSGLPIELIQSIEEEGHIPDLAPLIRLSRALGVRLGTLLDDHEELGPVITRAGTGDDMVRFITGLPSEGAAGNSGAAPADNAPAGKAPAVAEEHRGLHFKALAADKGSRHMEPFIVDIEPDAEQEKSSHEGEEFIYILSGSLSVEYGSSSSVLNEGDSVYYDSIVPHRVLSADGKPVRILAVIYTPM